MKAVLDANAASESRARAVELWITGG